MPLPLIFKQIRVRRRFNPPPFFYLDLRKKTFMGGIDFRKICDTLISEIK